MTTPRSTRSPVLGSGPWRLCAATTDPSSPRNALRDWCRFSKTGRELHRAGLAVAEPLGRVLRQPDALEVLAIEQFDTLLEAQVPIADWRDEYNDYRPHSSLGMLTPTEFATQCRTSTSARVPCSGSTVAARSS